MLKRFYSAYEKINVRENIKMHATFCWLSILSPVKRPFEYGSDGVIYSDWLLSNRIILI